VEEKQNVQNKEPGNGIMIESRILLLFLGLLIIGVIGSVSGCWRKHINKELK